MMKRIFLTLTALVLCTGAFAENTATEAVAAEKNASKAEKKEAVKNELKNHFKFYGFIRNYIAADTRESTAGTGDLFYWTPLDTKIQPVTGEDINENPHFTALAITSRVGVDVSGYKWNKTKFGAKIEADFYAGLSGAPGKASGTATLRLRQAFLTVGWDNLGYKNADAINIKMGQAWHPLAADLPDIFSLESGCPFNAFSRTPQLTFDYSLGKNWMFTASAIWQMQYLSAGPAGTTANYIRYGMTPEFYFGVTYRNGGFLGRVGMDLSSIKPYNVREVTVKDEQQQDVKVQHKVQDRITTVSPYLYLQYTQGMFKFKGKTIFANSGEQYNMMSGYALKDDSNPEQWEYTPFRTSSSWLTLTYGKKVQGALLLGYIQNLGTAEDMKCTEEGYADKSFVYFQQNGSVNIARMFRVQPEITYNIGKFTIGLEYMLTGSQYGDDAKMTRRAVTTENLHWVLNHRIQTMVKFTF